MQRLAKIGDVELTVLEDENPNDSVEVTSNSVESGMSVSDHVKANPSTVNLQGLMAGDNAADKLNKLKRYMYDAELLKYIGRNIYHNMVIKSINRNHEKRNRYGYIYDIELQEVRIAKSRRVTINVASPKTSIKVRGTTNAGRQQVRGR